VVGAFTTGDILQVLIVSIMFGCAVSLCGERAKPVADFIGRVSDIVFKMMNFVVRLAPLGVFGAIAFTVGKYGIGSLKQLGGLVALFYVAVASLSSSCWARSCAFAASVCSSCSATCVRS
jgi:aerobic C4-dicarboxylate transport protein